MVSKKLNFRFKTFHVLEVVHGTNIGTGKSIIPAVKLIIVFILGFSN